MGDIFNVSSNGQQGGITAGQINFGSVNRHMNEMIKDQFTHTLGDYTGSKVNLTAQFGDSEAMNYALEIMAFLDTTGWNVSGVDQVLKEDQSITGTALFKRDDHIEIFVGRNK